MKRLLIAVFFSLGAFAQAPPPTIQSISPASGPTSGGTTVTITGTNLNVAAVCLLPCPSRVVFGDISVDAIENSPTELKVVTPAHAAGVVDVTVVVTGREPVVVENGFAFTAGQEDLYERVLLPMYFKGIVPGAHESQWKSDFWIHNGGQTAVAIAPAACPPPTVCPPVFPLAFHLPAGHSIHNPPQFFDEHETNLSQILFIEKQGAKDVSMGLRVADISRDTLNAGTDLPVIRESELLTRKAQLFDVPFVVGQNFRLMLRVYDVTYSNADYEVVLYPAGDGEAEATYSFTLNATTPRTGPFQDEAAYAEFDLSSLLNLRRLWPERLRLEIHPKTPGSRYWAFVSVTNNETQLVTLITPQ